MPKISALPAGSALTGAEIVPLVQGGTTKSVTADDIATFIGATPGGTGTLEGMLSVKDYGAIGDGGSHPLSAFYASLPAAQADYYFATSLAQEIDYCACKACSNAAFGGDLGLVTAYLNLPDITWAPDQATVIVNESYAVNELAGKSLFIQYASVPSFVSSQSIASNTEHVISLVAVYPFTLDNATDTKYAIGYGEHGADYKLNKQIYIPPGRYRFGDDTWTIRNLASGKIFGAGRFVSTLTSNDCVLAFDGIWYTELSDFSCLTLTAGAEAALELDGNVPGHPYDTRGVQGVTLRNMTIDAGGSARAVAFGRQGGSGAQGDHILFLNVDFQNATFACYDQQGYNALANTIVGGNFQSYSQNGIYCNGGTIAVINTGFQSTTGAAQVLNGGYDINVGDGGSFESCLAYGCRSESLAFLRNAGAVRMDVRGCVQRAALSGWFASVVYDLNSGVIATPVGGHYGRLFVATTAGTSGTVEPVWPTDGSPIADGSVVWTENAYYSVLVTSASEGYYSASIDNKTCSFTVGKVRESPRTTKVIIDSGDSPYSMQNWEDIILVDTTAGNVTVSLPYDGQTGRVITVKKVDASAHTVTLASAAEGGGDLTIAGGSTGWFTLVRSESDTAGGTIRWYKIGAG